MLNNNTDNNNKTNNNSSKNEQNAKSLPEKKYSVSSSISKPKQSKLLIIFTAIVAVAGATFMGSKLFANMDNKNNQIDVQKIPEKNKQILDVVDAKEMQKRIQVEQQQAQQAQNNNLGYISPHTIVTPAASIIPNAQAQTVNPNNELATQSLPLISNNTNNAKLENKEDNKAWNKENDAIIKSNEEIENKIKDIVGKQVDTIISSNPSGYSKVKYLATNASATELSPSTSTPASSAGNTAKPPTKKLIFKAGDILYATLYTAINTDNGTNNVLAKLYGGEYNGATLIGKVEQNNKNISLNFTQLSPADRNKKAFAINAMAIRAQDANQGVAEHIDNHTIERYSYLFAASVLKAIGSVAKGNTNTVVVPGVTVIQTEENKDDLKTIGKRSAGELGTTMAGELGRNFNRPPTYSVPANQQIGVMFLSDIEE